MPNQYPLRPDITPMYFTGERHSDDNNWSGLQQLLRTVADYLDEHPEYNATSIHNLVIGVTTSCDDDSGYFTATLYAYPDSEWDKK